MSDQSLSILIRAILEKSSKAQIETEIEEIQQKFNKKPLEIKIDKKALEVLQALVEVNKKISLGIEQSNSKLNQQIKHVQNEKLEVNKLSNAYDELGKKIKTVKHQDANGETYKQSETYKNLAGKETTVHTAAGKETGYTVITKNKSIQQEQLEFEKRIGDIQNKNFNEAKEHLTQIRKLRQDYYNLNNKDTEQAKELTKQISYHQGQYNNIIKRKIDIGDKTKIEGIEAEKLNQLEKIREQTLRNINNIKSKNIDKDIIQQQKLNNEIHKQSLAQQDLLNRIRGMRGVDGKFIVGDNLNSLNLLESQIRGFDPTNKNFSKNMTEANSKLREISTSTSIYKKEIQDANKYTGLFGQSIFEAGKKFASWLLIGNTIMGIARTVRDGIQSITDIDTALTNLNKVTNESRETLNQFAFEANRVGMDLAKTTVDVVNATTEFARLGYSLQQATQLAKQALLYSNVGDIGVQEASLAIISAVKGFGVEVDSTGRNVQKIVDIYNEVGNNFAISSAGIGEAMRRSSASLYAAGNTMEEAVAMITAANAVVQDPTMVGTALKTVSMRIRGITDEGEEIQDLVPKLESAFKSIGIEIKKDNETFKSTYELMNDLAKVWENLTDLQKANITELVAGKRQGNIVISMLNNWKDATDSLTTALNSTNSALIENDKYMESIQAKQEIFKNTVMGKWQGALDSSVIKGFVVAMTNLVEVFGNLDIILALSTTAFLLWKGQAILGSITTLISFIATESMATVSTVALTGSVGILTKTFNALKLAIATNPIGLLAVGVTSAIIAFNAYTNHVKKAREENEKFIEKTQSQIETLKQQKSGLKELSSEYETLKEKENTTIEEKKRLLEIQKELVDKYGVSATGIDLEGQAYTDSIEAIKLRTLALDKELKKEQELLEFKVLAADALNTEDIRSSTNKRDKAQNKVEKIKKVLPYFEENDPYTAELYKKQLKELNKDIEDANEVIQNRSKDRQKYLEYDAQETIKTLESNGKKMSDSGKLFVSEFTKSLALQPKSLETQQESLEKFIVKVSNSNLDPLIEKYNNFVSAINSGDNSKDNVDGLEKTSASIVKLTYSLTKGDPVLKESAINFASLYPPTITAKKAIDALNDSVKENSFKTASDSLKFYQETLDKLNTDGLTSDLMVLARTHENLKDKTINNVEDYKKVLLEGVEESKNAWINAEFDKHLATQKLNTGLLSDSSTFFAKVNSLYGTDIKSWADLAKNKLLIDNNLMSTLGANWSAYYKAFTGSTNLNLSGGDRHNNIDKAKYLLEGLTPEQQKIAKEQAAVQQAVDKLLAEYAKIGDRLGKFTPSYSSSGSGGSSPPSPIDKENLSAELIRSFNYQVEIDKLQAKSLEKQIKIASAAKDYNQQISLTNKLLENQNKTVTDLKTANEKINQEEENIRKQNPLLSTESWFDVNGEATAEYKKALNAYAGATDDASKKSHKNIQDTFESLYNLKKAYRENTEAIDTYNTSISTTLENLNTIRLDALTTQIDKITSSTGSLDSQLSLLQLKFDLLSSTDFEDKINVLTEQIDASKSKMTELRSEFTQLKTQLFTTSDPTAIKAIGEALSKVSTEMQSTYKSIIEYNKQLEQTEFDEITTNADKSLSKIDKQVDKLYKNIDRLKNGELVDNVDLNVDMFFDTSDIDEVIEDNQSNYKKIIKDTKTNEEIILDLKDGYIDDQLDLMDSFHTSELKASTEHNQEMLNAIDTYLTQMQGKYGSGMDATIATIKSKIKTGSTEIAKVFAMTQMATNSLAWLATTDTAKRASLHAANEAIAAKYGFKYNSSTGVWSYAKGTIGTPNDGKKSLVGEEGRELGILPSGRTVILGKNGAELTDLPPNTQIIPHKETEEILKYTGDIDGKSINKYASGTKKTVIYDSTGGGFTVDGVHYGGTGEYADKNSSKSGSSSKNYSSNINTTITLDTADLETEVEKLQNIFNDFISDLDNISTRTASEYKSWENNKIVDNTNYTVAGAREKIKTNSKLISGGTLTEEAKTALRNETLDLVNNTINVVVADQFDQIDKKLQNKKILLAYEKSVLESQLASTTDSEVQQEIKAEIQSITDLEESNNEAITAAITSRYETEFSLLDKKLNKEKQNQESINNSIKLSELQSPDNYQERIDLTEKIVASEEAENAQLVANRSELVKQRDQLEVGSTAWNLLNTKVIEYDGLIQDSTITLAEQVNTINNIKLDNVKKQIDDMNESFEKFGKTADDIQNKLNLLKTWQAGDLSGINALTGQLISNNRSSLSAVQGNIGTITKKRSESETQEEWDTWTAQLETAYAKEQELILANANLRKEQLQNEFEQQYKALEKLVFDGSTSEDAQESLDKLKTEQQDYIKGQEKQLALDNLKDSLREDEITSFDTQIAQMEQMDKLSRSDLERLQKQVDIKKLEQKLQNQMNDKTIQTLKQKADGSWDFEYTADQDAIDETNKSLREAKIGLIDWEEQTNLNAQQKELDDKNKFLSKVKEIQDKALNGEYATQAEFNAEMRKLGVQLSTDYTGAWAGIVSSQLISQGKLTGSFATIQSSYKTFVSDMVSLSAQLSAAIAAGTSAGSDIFTDWKKKYKAMSSTERDAWLSSLNDSDKALYNPDNDDLTQAQAKEAYGRVGTYTTNTSIINNNSTTIEALYSNGTLTNDLLNDTSKTKEELTATIAAMVSAAIKTATNTTPATNDTNTISEGDQAFLDAGYIWLKNTKGGNKFLASPDMVDEFLSKIDENGNHYIVKMDTGGLTGNFDGGKLALLHEKELVLDKMDTSNILKAVDLTRNLMSNIRVPDFSSILNKVESTTSQVFHVTANFPNATNGEEIQNSLLSLPRLALQYK